MILTNKIATLLLLTYTIQTCIHAFTPTRTSSYKSVCSSNILETNSCIQMAPGGWGIGNPLDFKEEEFGTSQRKRRRRRKDSTSSSDSGGAAEDEIAYNADTADKIANLNKLENAQDFAQRIQRERDNLQLQKKKDLMQIAKMAGLGDRMKEKANVNTEVLGKFDDEFLGDADDESLDVRVSWED